MLPQLLAVVFGMLLAYLNSVPVNAMIRNGAKLWESREFHNANYAIKTLIGIVVSFYADGISFMALIDLVLMGAWLWVSFDIVLNLFIHHEWDYIGTTSKVDYWLTDKFRKKAGVIKTIICLVIIGGLNYLKYRL
jgi:hypothetical protein